MVARQGLSARLIRVYGFFRKEISSVLRQPRLLLTLIVAPFLILLIFGLGYRQSPPAFRTLLVLANNEAELVDEQNLGEAFAESIEVVGTSTDPDEARRQLAEGDVDLLIIAPEDPLATIDDGERANFTVVHGEVDPVLRSSIALVAESSVAEINRRVISDVVGTAQSESEDLESVLATMQESASVLVSALESGDREAAVATNEQIRGDLQLLETRSRLTDILLLSGAGSAIADDARHISSLEEGLDQAQADDPETALEGARNFETAVGELRDQIGSAQTIDADVLVSPFAVEVEQVNEVPWRVSLFYAPATIVVLIQHLTLTFAALSLVRERQLGLTEVFRASPLGSGEAVAGKYLGFGAISLTVAAGLTAAMLGFGVSVSGSWTSYLVVMALLVLASLGLGFVLSGLSKTDSQAVQFAMIALLLTIFFTGFVLPLDQLAGPVQIVSYLIPATYGIEAFHDIIFRGVAANPWIIAGLAAYALVTAVGAWFVVRRDVASVGQA